MSLAAALWAGLRDPATRPRTTLAFAIACAVTIAIGAPVLRALGHAVALAAK